MNVEMDKKLKESELRVEIKAIENGAGKIFK